MFVLLFAGLGCFVLSFVGMGLAPWTTLKNVTKAAQSSSNPYYDESGNLTAVGRGRKVYIKEGCWHCHSQFVRPVAGETFRYGPVSQAFETMHDIPHTFGTRRVGPDLSREAGRRSNDWHHAHFYNPRSTTPLSVMPAYQWLYNVNGATVTPTQSAEDLVSYMQYLGKTYEEQVRAIVYPRLFKVSGFPEKTDSLISRGEILYQENCVGCHGEKADGKGKTADFLLPAAANLKRRFVSPSEAYSVLNRGVLGSAMPSFREMPEKDLWALALYVAELGDEHQKRVLSQKESLSTSEINKGKTLFEQRCATCHGAKGAGDGVVATGLNPRPKDFTRRVFERQYFAEILKKGVPGSAMMPFADISDADVNSLAIYLESIFQKDL